MLIHRDCGGEVSEREDEPPYEFMGELMSVLRCERCEAEILGDEDLEEDIEWAESCQRSR